MAPVWPPDGPEKAVMPGGTTTGIERAWRGRPRGLFYTAGMSTRTYTIIGTGALGGYYGGLLARAGFETRFLLRSDFKHVRDHGLVVDSIRGNFTLPRVNAYADAADLPPSDVTLVCLKTTQNEALPRLLRSCTRGDGVVVVLQNGLEPEREAAAVVGGGRVLGGLCFLCANKLGPGHIGHVDYGHIHLGEYRADAKPGGITDRLQQVADDFNRADIETLAIEDLRLARWKKLMWNVPYNGLSAVLNQTTDVLMADASSLARVKALMREVQAAAEAVDGRIIDDAFIEQMLDYTAKMKPYKTSMMLDVEAGQPLETRAIVGDPLEAALAKGLVMPETQKLYAELQAMRGQDLVQDRAMRPGRAYGPA